MNLLLPNLQFQSLFKSHLYVICLCIHDAKKLKLALISTVLEGRKKWLNPDVDPVTSSGKKQKNITILSFKAYFLHASSQKEIKKESVKTLKD